MADSESPFAISHSPSAIGQMTLPSFNDSSLLRRALTHRSFLNEHPEELEDNERLEFLGDAVLDFVVGAFLYHRFPEMSEGRLTRLRAALVRTEQLAAFAAALEIGPLMRLGKGEEEGGGRQRVSLLCATFEAVVGAYYLDAGIDAVRAFVEPLLLPAAGQILHAEADVDSKSLLQEWAQAALGQTPRYHTVSATGPDHQKEFTVEVRLGGEVYGTGAGPNKQAAEQAAAQAALKKAGQASLLRDAPGDS
jgi:ribonuclease-3